MNHEAEFVPLEIDAIIPDPKAVQNSSVALEFAKLVELRLHDLLRQPTKLTEDLQLQFLGHSGKLRRAGGVEDDLERSHPSLSLHSFLASSHFGCIEGQQSTNNS